VKVFGRMRKLTDASRAKLRTISCASEQDHGLRSGLQREPFPQASDDVRPELCL